jgi:hypothetical protein
MPDNWPGQFSLSSQIFLQRAAATLKLVAEFQNKKESRPLFITILSPFQDSIF